MSDLISRQEAIDAIKRCESADSYDINNGLIMAMNAVADVPTIDPVKRGKWERHNEWDVCSVCAAAMRILSIYGMKRNNYCPNCGARME